MTDDIRRTLELAIEQNDETILMETGLSKARLTQKALHLSQLPQVAMQHPDLVGQINARLDAGKARRQKPADWK